MMRLCRNKLQEFRKTKKTFFYYRRLLLLNQLQKYASLLQQCMQYRNLFFHYNGILRNVLQTFLSTIGCSIEEKKAYITKMQFTINPSHQCLSFSIWPWCAYNCGLSRKHFFGTRIVLSYANKGGNHDDNCERLQHFANEVIKTE